MVYHSWQSLQVFTHLRLLHAQCPALQLVIGQLKVRCQLLVKQLVFYTGTEMSIIILPLDFYFMVRDIVSLTVQHISIYLYLLPL